MLTELCVVALAMSAVSLVLSGIVLLRSHLLREKFDGLDEKLVRSVMEEGGDASVEAVLQTMERIVEMDDGAIGTVQALKQARELHRR